MNFMVVSRPYFKKVLLLPLLTGICFFLSFSVVAQRDKEPGDWKKNLFTGGSVSFGVFNNTFLIGGNPVFGYSLTDYVDLALQVNYTYNSIRDYNGIFNNKLRQSVYGGGGWLRLYPLRSIFLQGQLEHNFIRQRSIPVLGPPEVRRIDAGSVLVGGGYTSNRWGKGGVPFYYLSILFDVSGNLYSPYTDAYGRSVPVFRGGIQIPLFQENGRRGRSYR
ncbi:MAG: hypothetical protein FJ340_01625 [Sphingomonadales bacterium]|nr:hypothetical protein [Sphingomonadales bacterium]